jgi:hypothetical protein
MGIMAMASLIEQYPLGSTKGSMPIAHRPEILSSVLVQLGIFAEVL